MYAEELQLSLILKPELIIQSCYLHTSYKKAKVDWGVQKLQQITSFMQEEMKFNLI